MRRFYRNGTGLLAALLLSAGCRHSDHVHDYRTENTLDTAWGIAYLTGYLFNGYIATRPAGTHDVTVQCSNGGSIRIEGRTDYNSQSAVLAMDLTYEFSNAHASVVATNLAVSFHPLTGAIRQTGAVRIGGDSYEDTVANSTGLVYDVTIDQPDRGSEALSNNAPYGVHIWTATNELDRVYRNIAGELDSVEFAWSYCISPSCGGTTNTYDIHVKL